MNILFCSDPLNNKTIDYDWEHEFKIAKECDLNIVLIDYDGYKNNPSEKFLKTNYIPEKIEPIIYRGWMMPVKMYTRLYDSLLKMNYKLINTPAEYQHCYYLPDSYSLIADHTPISIFTNSNEMPGDKDLKNLLSIFSNKPIIVKDYVKSQKHYWNDACYIPNASDLPHVKRVLTAFIEKQGDNFQGGLVFREFIELEPVGLHPKSNMPLTQEYRIFVLNKKPIACAEYWKDGNYGSIPKFEISQFQAIFDSIQSNFFTVDIAKKKNGEWIIIELGDGQVAEYLGSEGLEQYYKSIRQVV